jgi:hypothetical protein
VLDVDGDGDGEGDLTDPCPDDPLDGCLHEEGWIFGAYEGPGTAFDPAVQFDGDVSCSETCAFEGRAATGARWVCNRWDGGEGEGCNPVIDGLWSPDHCTEQIMDGFYVAGDRPYCGGEPKLRDFVDGVGNESWLWHAISCQCG